MRWVNDAALMLFNLQGAINLKIEVKNQTDLDLIFECREGTM